MKVSEAVNLLNASIGAKPDMPLEGVVAGDATDELRGVATCFAPTMAVLRRAAESGHNLLLCDAHPYYLYDPFWSGLPGIREALASSPAVVAKRRLIEESKLTILRLHSAWDAAMPTASSANFAKQLGFVPAQSAAGQDFVLCNATGMSVLELARRLPFDGVRLMGDPAWRLRKVAVAAGMASPARLKAMLADPLVDAVVVGEVIEWEGGPYMLDVQTLGRNCALLLSGFAVSLEQAASAWADWARSVMPDVRVEALNDKPCIWTPQGVVT